MNWFETIIHDFGKLFESHDDHKQSQRIVEQHRPGSDGHAEALQQRRQKQQIHEKEKTNTFEKLNSQGHGDVKLQNIIMEMVDLALQNKTQTKFQKCISIMLEILSDREKFLSTGLVSLLLNNVFAMYSITRTDTRQQTEVRDDIYFAMNKFAWFRKSQVYKITDFWEWFLQALESLLILPLDNSTMRVGVVSKDKLRYAKNSEIPHDLIMEMKLLASVMFMKQFPDNPKNLYNFLINVVANEITVSIQKKNIQKTMKCFRCHGTLLI